MDLDSKARELLDWFDVLRHPSDLDLLIFFARHPRSLLTGDQIATFLGYDALQISASLDILLAARLLSCTPNLKHAASLYSLNPTPEGRGWLPALMQLGSTREGRLALIAAIKQRWRQPNGGKAIEVAESSDG